LIIFYLKKKLIFYVLELGYIKILEDSEYYLAIIDNKVKILFISSLISSSYGEVVKDCFEASFSDRC
jgi:hypothetical protein